MSELTLSEISEKMRDIDFAMLSTRTAGGEIAARPMSNNRQVDYDGDNYFFTVEGKAELIRDKDQFAEHWTDDLDDWFKDGIETPGLVLVKVHAHRLHHWDGYSEGEIDLEQGARSDRPVDA